MRTCLNLLIGLRRQDKRMIAIETRAMKVVFVACVFWLTAYTDIVRSQSGDPLDEPIPELDLSTTEKAMVVQLKFVDPLSAEVESAEVVYGMPHGRIGAPPLHTITILDPDSNVVREFNAWNPLWAFAEDENGREKRVLLPEGNAIVTFPFAPNAATLNVTDNEGGQEVVNVDLIPSVHTFCRERSDDPDCAGIVNRPPTCDANGPYALECAGQTTSVTLDGEESSDPDDDPITLEWSGDFGTAEGPTPVVEFVGLGGFGVNLQVTDDFGAQALCSTTVSIADKTAPTLSAPSNVTAECMSPEGTPVAIGVATVSDVCDSNPKVANDAPTVFPVGTTIVTWTATDGSGNETTVTQEVSIVDTVSPELGVAVAPEELWPPNHKMVPIETTVNTTDVCDADPVIELISVVSNEPDNGTGDGDKPNDIQDADFGTDDRQFKLRAERSGTGDGRVYTVTYTATDASGNQASASATVTVPHDKGKKN